MFVPFTGCGISAGGELGSQAGTSVAAVSGILQETRMNAQEIKPVTTRDDLYAEAVIFHPFLYHGEPGMIAGFA
jgi:hypothetical protein